MVVVARNQATSTLSQNGILVIRFSLVTGYPTTGAR